MKKVEVGTIIRTICLVLALVNQGLTIAGHSVLPINDEQVNQLVTLIATIGASMWAWWKNNSFTQAALAADEIMHDLKRGNIDAEEE